MPVQVPSWMARDLRLALQYQDVEDLKAAVDASLIEIPVSSVNTDDVASAITAQNFDEYEVLDARCGTPWRSVVVTISGMAECTLVEIGDVWTDGIPTNSVQVILAAWASDEKFSPKKVCSIAAGQILVAWNKEKTARKITPQLSLAASGIELPEPHSTPSIALARGSEVEIPALSWILKEPAIYAELLHSMLRQKAPGLRFLYLYRLFERAYLNDTMDKLRTSFYDDPKRALQEAEKRIGNEKKSFQSLVEGTTSISHFEQIEQIFIQNSQSNGNRFMSAIHASVHADGDLGAPDAWRRGCAFVYKIRCAIVHSGMSGPIFESFTDAADACNQLNESLESAAIAFLQIAMA